MPDLHLFTTALTAFFAIMNPIANTTIFVGLTEGEPRKTVNRIALVALLLALAIVATFTLTGSVVLDTFGITIPAFRIAGGLLVALVGFHMLQGTHSRVHKTSDADNAESADAAIGIAVSPLALPVLAGPGTIVTAMNYGAHQSLAGRLTVLAAFLVICILSYICFTQGRRLTAFLGKNAIMVVTRLMGLILAALGTQMVIDGVTAITNH